MRAKRAARYSIVRGTLHCVLVTTNEVRFEMDTERATNTQLLKGVLDLAELTVLDRGPTYGYDVVRQLREAGLEGVGDASVYGTLRRLFTAGALSSRVEPSDEGPNRKYYELTSRGEDLREANSKAWATFSSSMDGLLAAGGRP